MWGGGICGDDEILYSQSPKNKPHAAPLVYVTQLHWCMLTRRKESLPSQQGKKQHLQQGGHGKFLKRPEGILQRTHITVGASACTVGWVPEGLANDSSQHKELKLSNGTKFQAAQIPQF